ncbi:TPA: Ail/Lom family outer membrane beta-barrel protein [Escherichia coli]
MEVNKKQLADIFGASIRTIQNWQEQGMPVLRGGGKGNEVLYDSAAVIRWYAERDAEIENEKLRREVEELRQASETDLQPGTIEYERHRLTRAQADAQELKNARDSAEVVETAFCTFVLSRIAGEIASILDGIPLSVQRRFPELENRHVDFLKRDIIKAMNKAAALDELITDNKGKTHDVLTGSDDGRHSNTSLAWGAGVQFNPTESVAIDIAYEGSGSGDWRTDGFIVGVGYKF